MAYLDYFVKTDVAMREGQLHPQAPHEKKQTKSATETGGPNAAGGEEEKQAVE